MRLPYFDAESSAWGVTVAEAIPVQVSAASQLDIEDLPVTSIDPLNPPLKLVQKHGQACAGKRRVPSVTMLPVVGGFGLGLFAAGAIRGAAAASFTSRSQSKRKLDGLLRALDRAQGHVEVGQAARSYLSAWSNHASTPS